MKINFSALYEVASRGEAGSTKCTLQEMQFGDFHNFIKENAWSPSVFNKNFRNNKNFKSSSLIVIDIDDSLTIEEAKKILKNTGFIFSLTLSRHHQLPKKDKSPCDRFRIVIPLKEPILNQADYKKSLAKFCEIYFPKADKSCIDSARFFFASSSFLNNTISILNLEGKPFDIEIDLKGTFLIGILNDPNIPIHLKNDVDYFTKNVNSICLNGEWNKNLNKIAFLLRMHGKSREEISLFFKENSLLKTLDQNDLKALNSCFEAAEKKEILGSNSKINRFVEINRILQKELTSIHILLSEERVASYLLENEDGQVRYIDEESIQVDVTNVLLQHNIYKNPTDTKQLTKFFLQSKQPLNSEPQLVRFKSETGLAFKVLEFDPIQGDCPLFSELLSRMKNSKAFCAYLWSIFENKSYSQQYCWIIGNGQDGKSIICSLLNRALGKTAYNENAFFGQKDSHATASYLGKRLIIFPDNSDKNLPTTDLFKSLTGGDEIRINPKNKKGISKKLDLKILITANTTPRLSSQKADQRRAIIVELSPFKGEPDSEYGEKLWHEISAIMYLCKKEYESLTQNHGPITTSKALSEQLAELNEEAFQYVLDELFILDPASYISSHIFRDVTKPLCKIHEVDYDLFKDWLIRKGLAKNERPQKSGRVWVGLRFKNNHQIHKVSNVGNNYEI